MVKKSLDPLDLVGRCFVIFGNDKKVQYQGIVRGRIEPGYFLVQYFEALMGHLSTLAIYEISQMRPGREEGSFEFFMDDEHLRDWMRTYG